MFAHSARPLAGAAVIALLLAPGSLSAQITPVVMRITPAEVQAEANRLHDEAMAIARDMQDLSAVRDVARTHAGAVSLRLVADPRAVDCHRIQANLLYLLGEHAEAQEHLERAAGLAIGNGDLASAADTYVEAAVMAKQVGNDAEADRFAREAHRLAVNPAVPSDVRRSIRQRVTWVPVIPGPFSHEAP